MFNKNQKINCEVYDCKYCNKDKEICELSKITVTKVGNADVKEDTVCDSYKKDKAVD